MILKLEWKRLLNVSDMRETVSGFFSFSTTTWYRVVFILCYEYPTSLFSLCIYKGNERMGIQKTRKRGIRGSENKGNEENGICWAHMQGQVC
jgi:hypothetical protein